MGSFKENYSDSGENAPNLCRKKNVGDDIFSDGDFGMGFEDIDFGLGEDDSKDDGCLSCSGGCGEKLWPWEGKVMRTRIMVGSGGSRSSKGGGSREEGGSEFSGKYWAVFGYGQGEGHSEDGGGDRLC